MEDNILQAEVRDSKGGKGNVRQLRNSGFTPGILYQDGGSIPIKVPTKDLNNFTKHYGENAILKLSLEKKEKDVFIKELQRDIVKQNIIHCDFQPVYMNKVMQVPVPIHLQGDQLVENRGGVIHRQLTEIEIEALPKDIPQFIEIDISNLDIGDKMQVSEIKHADEIKILSNPDENILSITKPRSENEIDNNEIENGADTLE